MLLVVGFDQNGKSWRCLFKNNIQRVLEVWGVINMNSSTVYNTIFLIYATFHNVYTPLHSRYDVLF